MRWPGGGKGPSGRREEGANTSPSQKSKQVWSGCRGDVDVDVSGPSQIIMSTIRMMRPTNGRGESRGTSLLVRMHHRCNMIYVLRGSRAVVSLRLWGDDGWVLVGSLKLCCTYRHFCRVGLLLRTLLIGPRLLLGSL